MSSTLCEMFQKFITEYAMEFEKAWTTNNFKRPLGDVVRKDIVEKIQEIISDSRYKVKGSVGSGRWSRVPWIAVFDTRITSSAQRGVYIVYLLNKDTKTLYLTLNQGATDVSKNVGTSNEQKLTSARAAINNLETTTVLKEGAKLIRDAIGIVQGVLYGSIDSGSEAYDAGCIYYKEYQLHNLPNDDILIDDLNRFLDIYKLYYKICIQHETVQEEDNTSKGDEGEKMEQISTAEAIGRIKKYIAEKGFTYNDNLIENFYLSLKSKPFVILAGTSGTGKTRLVKLFAEAIGAEYRMVPVRPDWSDGSDLFGHYDLNGRFIDGPVCECFELAFEKPNRPVFLCLDEMNLARVEYYLSDFMSVIESREKMPDGKVVTAPIAQYERGIPDNLYIVGTVNMDETTFPFSKKVLDRANTLEFSYVNLIPDFDVTDSESESLKLPNSFLRTEYLVLSRDCAREQEFVQDICTELQRINEILVKANAQVGYRVRDEIVFYMLNNKTEGNLLEQDEAFDNEIMQKILPRIQGSSASVRNMLCELFEFCASDHNQKTGDSDSEKMQKVLSDTSVRYRKSAEKLELMTRRFEEDGFTSYWL